MTYVDLLQHQTLSQNKELSDELVNKDPIALSHVRYRGNAATKVPRHARPVADSSAGWKPMPLTSGVQRLEMKAFQTFFAVYCLLLGKIVPLKEACCSPCQLSPDLKMRRQYVQSIPYSMSKSLTCRAFRSQGRHVLSESIREICFSNPSNFSLLREDDFCIPE